jgi:hypothetical protein
LVSIFPSLTLAEGAKKYRKFLSHHTQSLSLSYAHSTNLAHALAFGPTTFGITEVADINHESRKYKREGADATS